MTDKERVVKGLEVHTDMHVSCRDCPYMKPEDVDRYCQSVLIKDALKLLKSQPDVVQCGECKHYKDGFCYNPNAYDDEITCGNTSPDWYCADGKRR